MRSARFDLLALSVRDLSVDGIYIYIYLLKRTIKFHPSLLSPCSLLLPPHESLLTLPLSYEAYRDFVILRVLLV